MNMTLSPGKDSIRITWDDPRLDDLMSMLFSPWKIESESCRYAIHANMTSEGYLLQTPLEKALCPDESDLLSHLEFNITTLSQKILVEYLQIHAACIDYQGTGILIIGDHGSGKSTLALTALSYGMKVLTDDVCVIDTLNDRVIAFPRPIKASDHTIEIISPAVVESCPVRRVMDDTSFFFHYRSPNAYYRPASRPEYLFFLKRPSDNASVARLNETDSMSGLLRQGFNYIDKQSSFVHELLQIIRKTHRYELAFTSNWNAIDTIISTIQTPL